MGSKDHPDPADQSSQLKGYRKLHSRERAGDLGGLESSTKGGSASLSDPEPEWGKERWKSTWVWIGLVGILAVFALAFHIFMRIQEDRARGAEVKVPSNDSVMNFMEKASAGELRNAIEVSVRGYLGATSDAERCRFIIDGEGKEEKLREFFQRKDIGAAPQGFGEIVKTEPASIGGRPFVVALASGRQEGKAWLLQLVPTETEMKIEWEATVCYGEVSWSQFLKERSEKAVQMRVYLEGIRAPLSAKIPDERYRTFEVSVRGQKVKALTHLKRGSALEREFAKVVPAQAVQPVNVRLRWADDPAGVRRLEIVELIHNYWIAPQSPEK